MLSQWKNHFEFWYMKILEIVLSLSNGGAERFVVDISNEMSKLEVEHADVMIFIGAPNNIKNMANADSSKVAKRSKATLPILSKRLERSASGDMRWVIADYPTNALAQEASMSLLHQEL